MVLPMRLLLHDFAGHPFQIQLSRQLAMRGHEVLHLYCQSRLGPKADLEKKPDDPRGLSIHAVQLAKPIAKDTLVRRRIQEVIYGRKVLKVYREFRPEAVISANAPLDVQRMLISACRSDRATFVYWLQDLIGVGAYRVLRGRWLGLGSAIGWYFTWMEEGLLRRSDRVVLITEDHVPVMRRAGVDPDRITVIENWAPLEDFPVEARDNPWARQGGLDRAFCFLYSGTLGMKHNPDLLLQLAVHFKNRPEVRVVVISEGKGAQWLMERKSAMGVDNLEILGFQPIGVLGQVHASADVLVAILEPDAGIFSVPSKVLTYHCAARPLLLAVPKDNLASRIVTQNRSGLAVAPGDLEGFVRSAQRLYEDRGLRQELAANARRYAESRFNIQTIADRFERLISRG